MGVAGVTKIKWRTSRLGQKRRRQSGVGQLVLI